MVRRIRLVACQQTLLQRTGARIERPAHNRPNRIKILDPRGFRLFLFATVEAHVVKIVRLLQELGSSALCFCASRVTSITIRMLHCQ